MFKWFSGAASDSAGLDKMRAEFGQMLDSGRHIFDAASNALLGGTDLSIIHDDLFETDKRINRAEQQIRREIVIHATVHGSKSFPTCLVLMSVVKDAERIGDYAKNIFDLAKLSPNLAKGVFRDDLIRMKDDLSRLMASTREAFDTQDVAAAKQLIREAQRIEKHCDNQLREILTRSDHVESSASFALAYRYFKRVGAHSRNVLSSIVQPIDKIDFAEKLPPNGTG